MDKQNRSIALLQFKKIKIAVQDLRQCTTSEGQRGHHFGFRAGSHVLREDLGGG